MATDSSAPSVSTQNEDLVDAHKDQTEKIVLPTNESSEKLLRIRHTVTVFSLIFPCGFWDKCYLNVGMDSYLGI